MCRTIARDIDKPDKVFRVCCADPSEAVTIYLRPTIFIKDTMLKSLSVQSVQRFVAECIAPNVFDVQDRELQLVLSPALPGLGRLRNSLEYFPPLALRFRKR
jgi:hypothetical protein